VVIGFDNFERLLNPTEGEELKDILEEDIEEI
jgi:hypothetical protein